MAIATVDSCRIRIHNVDCRICGKTTMINETTNIISLSKIQGNKISAWSFFGAVHFVLAGVLEKNSSHLVTFFSNLKSSELDVFNLARVTK